MRWKIIYSRSYCKAEVNEVRPTIKHPPAYRQQSYNITDCSSREEMPGTYLRTNIVVAVLIVIALFKAMETFWTNIPLLRMNGSHLELDQQQPQFYPNNATSYKLSKR